MNVTPIRRPRPALLFAPPAGQHRVCRRWMRSERARDTSQRTSTYAEVVTSYRPGARLNTGVGMRVRRDRPQSP
jgi:hypothetical protein